MEVPPGIVYLSKKAPRLGVPLIALYLFHLVCRGYLEIELPARVVALSYFLCLPTVFTFHVLYQKWSTARAAASLGAVLPPTSGDDPTPGGILTLIRAVRNFKAEYLGT
jgi:hypothetical protein